MKARWFRTCGMLLACASLSVYAACGDDSGTDAGTAGIGGTGGASGASGGAGAAGAAGKAGGGGSAGTAAVTCGGATCTVNGILKMINTAAAACCATTTPPKCGQVNTAMKCLQNAAPGKPDPSCPGVPVMALGMSLTQAGCCTPAGQCGADYTTVGWGCVARADIDPSMGMGGPFASIACNPNGADAGGDAGL